MQTSKFIICEPLWFYSSPERSILNYFEKLWSKTIAIMSLIWCKNVFIYLFFVLFFRLIISPHPNTMFSHSCLKTCLNNCSDLLMHTLLFCLFYRYVNAVFFFIIAFLFIIIYLIDMTFFPPKKIWLKNISKVVVMKVLNFWGIFNSGLIETTSSLLFKECLRNNG